MSFEALGWASNYRGRHLRKIVLLALANARNPEDGRCFPSFNYIAEWCGCSRRSAIRSVDDLETEGAIIVVNRGTRSNEYRLLLEVNLSLLGGDQQAPDAKPAEEQDRESAGDRESQTRAPESLSGDRESQTSAPEPPASAQVAPETVKKQEETGTETVNETQGQSPPPLDAAPDANEQGQQGEQAFTVWDVHHPTPIRPEGDNSPVVVLIPIKSKDGRPFAVTEFLMERWGDAYDRLDVPALMKHVREWCFGHPMSLVTPKKIRDWLINTWLSKEQGLAGEGRSRFAKGAGGGGPAGPKGATSRQASAMNGLQTYADRG